MLGAIFWDTVASRKRVAFEARIRLSSIANDVAAIFCGLMEENGAVHDAKVDNTGVTIDNDFIGFSSIHYNSGTAITSNPTITPVTGQNAKLQFVYKKDGQTLQVPIAAAHTLVADAWVKVGFLYDPEHPPLRQLKAYVNGVELGTYVTATMLDAATFPDGEEMGFTLGGKSGSAAASNLDCDWWMVGMCA